MNSTTQCHCCLLRPAEKDLKKPHTSLGITEIFAVMMEECFAIQLFLGDGNCGICELCLSRLRDSCQFKLQVQACQAKLRKAARGWGFKDSPTEKKTDSRKEKSPTVRDVVVIDDSGDEHGADDADDPMDRDEVFGELSTHEQLGEAPSISPGDDETLLQSPDVATPGKDARPRSIKLEVLERRATSRHVTSARDVHDTPRVAAAPPPPPPPQRPETSHDVSKRRYGPLTSHLGSSSSRIHYEDGVQLTKTPPLVLKPSGRTTGSRKYRRTLKSEPPSDTNLFDDGAQRSVTSHGSRPSDRTDVSHNTNKNIYMCEICGDIFTDEFNLNTHTLTHNIRDEVPAYSCKSCSEEFSSEESLIEHFNVHMDYKSYVCDICAMAFDIKSNLISHMQTHEYGDGYLCVDYKKTFEFGSFTADSNEKKLYTCKDCDKEFKLQIQLNVHKKIHDAQPPTTSDVTSNKYSPMKDIKVETRDKLYRSVRSKTKFKHDDEDYNEKKANKQKRPYACNYCKKRFVYKKRLISHEKEHKQYSCEKCDKQFKREKYLLKHNLKFHSKDEPTNTNVWDTKNVEKNIEKMRTHVYKLAKVKYYTCEECNIKFKFVKDLERHKKVHTGEYIETNIPTYGRAKTYICKECNIKFRLESDLERHKKVHTGENIETNVSTYKQAKTYICKECNIRFKLESDLERHKKVHTGVNIETNDNTCGEAKTYNCKECNIKFKSESDLERHKIIHTGASENIETNDHTAENINTNSHIYTAENIDTNDRIHTNENIDTNDHINTGASENIETNDHIHTSENIDTNDHTYAQGKTYSCKECNNQFKLQSDLEKHKCPHTAENIETNEHAYGQAKTYSCKECNNKFILESDLEKHKCVHENIETKEQATTYTCKECNNVFKSESGLERHKRIHTAEKTYECEICETIFFSELDLLGHMETHIYK